MTIGRTRTRTMATGYRRFRRSTVAVLGVLALAAAGLGAAAVLRGPKLDAGSVNAQSVISRAGQKLVLHADQTLAPVDASQVEVSPATPFTVESTGPDVQITFTGVLDYATAYSIRVDYFEGSATGLRGALDFGFTTPDVAVTTLLRRGGLAAGADKPSDQIVRSALTAGDGAGSEVVFEAPRIQQFQVVPGALAVVELDEQGASSLVVSVEGADGASTGGTVFTPAGGRIQNLHASVSAGLFGYTVNGGEDAVTGREYQNTLFVFDPRSVSGKAEEVTGFGGEPLRVVDWQFVPGSSSIVVQGTDQQLYQLDPIGGAEPVPLGLHAELRDFLAGGLQLVVADPAGTSTIDLSTGQVAPLVQSTPDVDPALYPGTIVTLASGATVRQYDEVDYSSAAPVQQSLIVYADDAGTRELYRPASAGARIRGFCVSPNGQYLAVETIASGAVTDGYPLPGYSEMTTTFVQIATGIVTRSVPGFLPDWCA